MTPTITKYFVFPAGKPEEKFEVLPRDFNDGSVGFVKVQELAGTNDWMTTTEVFTWANPFDDGAFVNNDVEQLDVTGTYDIVKE